MVKRIFVSVSTNKVGSECSDVIEVDDDATEEEINREALNWMWDYIDFYWCPEDER